MAEGRFAFVGKFSSSTNDEVPQHTPGQEVEQNGSVYKYVQFDNGAGNVAAAAGKLAYWKTIDTVVTSDNTDAVQSTNMGAGFFTYAATDQYYTWIQIKGASDNDVTTAANGAVGQWLVNSSTTDGSCGVVAVGTAPTHQVLGRITSRTSASAAGAFIDVQRV